MPFHSSPDLGLIVTEARKLTLEAQLASLTTIDSGDEHPYAFLMNAEISKSWRSRMDDTQRSMNGEQPDQLARFAPRDAKMVACDCDPDGLYVAPR